MIQETTNDDLETDIASEPLLQQENENINSSETDELNPKIVNFKYKEGGYGWFVVAATVLCGGLALSNYSNYPLVQDQLLLAYNNTENYAIYAGKIPF
jgi:hypothetical protein